MKKFIKENLFYIIIISLFFVINFVRIPYEVEMPGGIINLTERVKIDGKKVKIKGSYNMAYVGTVEGYIPYILYGLINPDWDVSKIEDNLYEGETIEDANKRNKIYLENSKNQAIVAALKQANIEYETSNIINHVLYIDPLAKTDLKVGDHIISVDKVDIDNVNMILEMIKENKIDKKLDIIVERDGKTVNCYAKIIEIAKEKKIGIVLSTTFDIKSAKKIEIDTKASESGPSGGLMMGLMIYSSLTDTDLTKGRKVVGTGTINSEGQVGEIGGVKYKLMGAVKNKADVFLVPKENYKEAIKVKEEKKYKIEIVKIETLKEAIDYLGG